MFFTNKKQLQSSYYKPLDSPQLMKRRSIFLCRLRESISPRQTDAACLHKSEILLILKSEHNFKY